MKMFTKAALTLLAATSFATVAVASPGDGAYGAVVREQAKVNTLEHKLENQGVKVDQNFDLRSANTPRDKAELLSERAQDLQLKLNQVKSQHS